MEEPQIEDAVNYMNEVGQFRRMNQCFQIKERFKDDEERYKDFLSIMIELKDKGYQKLCFCLQCRIGDGSLIQRLKYLFEGNTDLLKKFTMFLPPDYDSGMPDLRASVGLAGVDFSHGHGLYLCQWI